MSDAPLPDRGVKISLREQAEEAQRELTMRYRVYSARVKAGSMTETEKAIGIGIMRAIRDTLRLLALHEDVVRAALRLAMARDGSGPLFPSDSEPKPPDQPPADAPTEAPTEAEREPA